MKRKRVDDRKQNREIRTIVILLTSAIVGAFLLAGLMLYFYSPSGLYVGGQTVLDPQVMTQINQQEGKKKKGQERFVFEKTQFSYFDPRQNKTNTLNVSQATYEQFYHLIEPLKSLEPVDDKTRNLFSQPHLSRLTTTMRSTNETAGKVFQVIEFTPDDYFRVQLHGEQDKDEWAYFYLPQVNQFFTSRVGL